MTDRDSRTLLVWDLLVCSQLTEPSLGGMLPSSEILLTFTLQSQLFKAGRTSAPCQPDPAVKSGSWNLKAHAALLHRTAWAFLSRAQHAVSVCNSASCLDVHEAVWECMSVNHKTFTFSAGMEKKSLARSPSVSLPVCLCLLNALYSYD